MRNRLTELSQSEIDAQSRHLNRIAAIDCEGCGYLEPHWHGFACEKSCRCGGRGFTYLALARMPEPHDIESPDD